MKIEYNNDFLYISQYMYSTVGFPQLQYYHISKYFTSNYSTITIDIILGTIFTVILITSWHKRIQKYKLYLLPYEKTRTISSFLDIGKQNHNLYFGPLPCTNQCVL